MPSKSMISRGLIAFVFLLCASVISVSAAKGNKGGQPKPDKDAMHQALNAIKPEAVHPDNLAWDPSGRWHTVHGAGTSELGGHKLVSMKGSDGGHHVGISYVQNKKVTGPPVVSASWAAKPESGQHVINGLKNAVDAKFNTQAESSKKSKKKRSIMARSYLMRRNLSSKDKKALHAALANVHSGDLVDLSWEGRWVPVHGLGTSSLGGFKLGSMKGSGAGGYHVGIFHTSNKQIHPPPIVAAVFGGVPSGDEIIQGLTHAINSA